MAKLIIRDATTADHPFVEDFWRVYVSTSYYAYGTPAAVLIGKMRALLRAPSWRCIVACHPDVPEEILGYLVYRPEPFALAWCQTAKNLKRRGIARLLFESARGVTGGPIETAFFVPDVGEWLRAKGITLRFRPYISDAP